MRLIVTGGFCLALAAGSAAAADTAPQNSNHLTGIHVVQKPGCTGTPSNARVPTGTANVKAGYRAGSGAAGNASAARVNRPDFGSGVAAAQPCGSGK